MKQVNEKSSEPPKLSRRNFLGRTGAVASVGLVAPLALAHEGDPVRVALIGAGNRMGALLPAILKQHVEIVACADPNPKSLNEKIDRIERAVGKRPEGFTRETDFETVLRRDDVQAALTAAPCDLHARIQLEALARGKHIYAEKPACLTLAEAQELQAAQISAPDVVVQIGFQRRANPRYVEGIRLIREGEIGKPIEGRAAWTTSGGPLGLGKWLERRERSGDWMIENACHTWDVFNWLAGALPVAAYGAGRRDVFEQLSPGRDVTDYYVATLEYPGGLLVNYTHSSAAPRSDNGAFSGTFERVAGLNGGIDLGAGRISYGDPQRAPRLIHERQPDMTGRSIAHFFDCIREGKQPASTLEHGIAATLAGLLVRRAVDERRRVEMEEILNS